MKKLLAIIIPLCLANSTARAQEAPEYRMEIGAGAGLMAYQGDFSGSLTRNMQPMGALVARYKKNPRMAWNMSIGYGQLKGSSTGTDSWMPGITDSPRDFKSSVIDMQLRYEYNFWPFGTGREYYGAQHLTPFIAIGVGLSFAGGDGSGAGGQLPIGAGVKYKLADRLNLTLDWTMHFTGNDLIDGAKDPNGIKSSGLFKNTDCYSVIQLSLTYDFWERCRTCHNDKD